MFIFYHRHYPIFYEIFLAKIKKITDLIKKKEYAEASSQAQEIVVGLDCFNEINFPDYKLFLEKLITFKQLYQLINHIEKKLPEIDQKSAEKDIENILITLTTHAHMLNFMTITYNNGTEEIDLINNVRKKFLNSNINLPFYQLSTNCHNHPIWLNPPKSQTVNNYQQLIMLFNTYTEEELQTFAKIIFSNSEQVDPDIYCSLNLYKNNIFDYKYKLLQFAINLSNNYKVEYKNFIENISSEASEEKNEKFSNQL